jgi:hypothetical protein
MATLRFSRVEPEAPDGLRRRLLEAQEACIATTARHVPKVYHAAEGAGTMAALPVDAPRKAG